MKKIFLDYNSTTPVFKEVLDEMLPCFSEIWGNPSSSHCFGRQAKTAIDTARIRVAEMIKANPEEIVFTSGGTEANNLALKCLLAKNASNEKNHVITTQIEHSSIYNAFEHLEKDGFEVSWLPTDKNGVVSVSDFQSAITERTLLASIMLANNVTGALQPVREIARIASAKSIFIHTDAVQAAGKMPLSVNELGVDLLTLSAHKIYGPKGAGALYVRRGLKTSADSYGGDQEGKLRAGTENVPGIVGFGKACEMAQKNLDINILKMESLRDRLETGILSAIPFAKINALGSKRVPNTSSISFPGVENEMLAVRLDLNGIAVSIGSACNAGKAGSSRVLKAMSLPLEELHGSLRFSVGLGNINEDIDQAIETLKNIVLTRRQKS